ncbi:MAG: DUF6702 family protein [Hyphomonas sp.]
MFLRGLFAYLLFTLFAFTAAAHRVGVPLSTIEWNANTQSWEVVHKLSLHDVEKKVHLMGETSDFLTTNRGQKWLREFVDRRFLVTGGPTQPQFVGIEYDADVVWIYYQIAPTDSLVTITSNLRFETDEKLYNLLNITREDSVDSHIFRDGNQIIETKLGKP